jgi:beta propeller repeat protein
MKINPRKMQVIVVCVLLSVVFILSVGSSQEFIITENEGKQYSPAICKDIVVWTDERHGNQDIYGYNLSTQKEFQITTDTEDQNDPAIYNNIVVWVDERNGNYDIYEYNLLTGEEFSICTSLGEKCDPAIYGDIVVWKNYGRDSPDISGYNLSTHQKVAIGENPHGDSPAIYGDIVVWEMYKNHHGIINGYNLSTSKKFPIAKTYNGRCHGESYCSGDPKIYNNIVVWAGCRDKNPDIYGYNLLTNQEFQITTHEDHQNSPAIYENVVVWVDYRNGNPDIYGADISPPYRNILSKSKIRMHISEHYWTAIWMLIIGLSVWIIWRFIWYIKNYGDTSKVVPQSATQKDFKKTFLADIYFLVFAVISVPMGITTIFDMEHPSGFLYLITSAIYVLIYIWRQKIPYIRITDDEIIFFKNIAYSPKVINKNDIQKINVETWTNCPYKAHIFLKSGKKIEIFFSSFHEDDKEDLVDALIQLVGVDKKNGF